MTILAVMLVPMSSIGAQGFAAVSRRLFHRIAGCLAGAALAAAFLFPGHGDPALLILGTAIGVLVGRHIENGRSDLAYVGTQFTLAILVTLVPDTFTTAMIGPARDRLLGILFGMALLEPVLLSWHILWPGGARHRETAGVGSLDL